MAMTYAEAKERLLNIGFHAITLVPETGIAATDIGKLGTISGIGEWGLGADAGVPFGVLKVFETDAVGVQDKGYAEIDIEHNATASNEVTNGSWVELDGAGKGALAAAATGVRAVAVDATNHKAIVKLG
jgi:hypothetical protein